MGSAPGWRFSERLLSSSSRESSPSRAPQPERAGRAYDLANSHFAEDGPGRPRTSSAGSRTVTALPAGASSAGTCRGPSGASPALAVVILAPRLDPDPRAIFPLTDPVWRQRRRVPADGHSYRGRDPECRRAMLRDGCRSVSVSPSSLRNLSTWAEPSLTLFAVYENPLLSFSSRPAITDAFLLSQHVSSMYVPGLSLSFSPTRFLRGAADLLRWSVGRAKQADEGQDERSQWKIVSVWSECGDIAESESFGTSLVWVLRVVHQDLTLPSPSLDQTASSWVCSTTRCTYRSLRRQLYSMATLHRLRRRSRLPSTAPLRLARTDRTLRPSPPSFTFNSECFRSSSSTRLVGSSFSATTGTFGISSRLSFRSQVWSVLSVAGQVGWVCA